MAKLFKNLKANKKNPRVASDEKVEMLRHTLAEFGDISGIVFNARTEQLVGGHQRQKVMEEGQITITKTYKAPTKKGTTAIGYVLYRGERYAYREVDWDEVKEKAANIAANAGVGSWDEKLLSEMMRDIDAAEFDLDLTLFDEDERGDLLVPTTEPNFQEGSASDQGKLDEKKRVECPECGHRFTPGWS